MNNSDAILAIIAELYAQVAALTEQNAQLRAALDQAHPPAE